jgi:predicted ATPase
MNIHTCETEQLVRTANKEGYLMIESLYVEKFRPFGSLDLTNLKRVNIIVGKNASGKTSLLEAIKVGLDAMPGTLPWLNSMRGMAFALLANLTADQFKELYIDWFHEFNTDSSIVIRIGDSSKKSASLSIYFDPKRATTTQPGLGFRPDASLAVPTTIIPLVFDRSDFQGQKNIFVATINPQGQFVAEPPTGRPMGMSSGFFSNSYYGVPQENAAWLSRLRVEKRGDEVIEAIHRHFPFIRDVTSEITAQGVGTVYADIPHLSRKIPLSLVSGGMSRLFTLILAIVTFGKGVVLIDEVENGIFHDQYQMLWKTVADLAEHNNTQVFVATHSGDCLRAAQATIKERPSEFSFLRVVRKNGNSTVEMFTGEQLESALEKDGEVRD